jgi:hypothetical protein
LATEPRSETIFFEIARDLIAPAVGLHPLPEMDVVVMLACIVEGAAFFRRSFPPLSDLPSHSGFEEIVAVVHVREVMLVA